MKNKNVFFECAVNTENLTNEQRNAAIAIVKQNTNVFDAEIYEYRKQIRFYFDSMYDFDHSINGEITNAIKLFDPEFTAWVLDDNSDDGYVVMWVSRTDYNGVNSHSDGDDLMDTHMMLEVICR